MRWHLVFRYLLLLCCCAPWQIYAQDEIEAPALSIIIDDMGDQLRAGREALTLPGQVTYSFLPHTPFARKLAIEAHALNKEIMLHAPMQAVDELHPPAQTLNLDMGYHDFVMTFARALDAVPYVVGINNHQGSLITQHPGHMSWLMEELGTKKKLYFVDSRTTPKSVARQIAEEHHVPNIKRDIFLDHDKDPQQISTQFDRLVNISRKYGRALAIGHPYPETLQVLAARLPELQKAGIRLVKVSSLIKIKQQPRETRQWQTYLSR